MKDCIIESNIVSWRFGVVLELCARNMLLESKTTMERWLGGSNVAVVVVRFMNAFYGGSPWWIDIAGPGKATSN